jgi:predicted Zn-dependent peptidase
LAFPHDHSADASSNGATTLTDTRFYAWGNADEAASFIGRIASTLPRLPLDRIDQQRSIILAEEAAGGGGASAELLTERYGARRHGVVAFRQLGLHKLVPADVADWSARYFTADNAILCASGPPSGRLALELPRGQRTPLAPAEPIEGPLPRWTSQAIGQVALGVLTGHDPAAGMAHRIFERRLFRRLRQDLALSYSVQSASQLIDRATLHRVVVADSKQESSVEVTGEMLTVAQQLAESGPTRDELLDDLDVIERQLRDDPRAIAGWMMHAAECYLNGIEVQEFEDYLESRSLLTPVEVRDAWARALATAILVVPPWVDIAPQRMAARTWTAKEAPTGRGATFHPPGIGRLRSGPRATVSDEAISVALSNQPPRTIRFDRAAALIRSGPLTRTVIDVDGAALSIDAAQFGNSRDLVARLDSRIPPSKWIDVPTQG